jgi:hypothetical protein
MITPALFPSLILFFLSFDPLDDLQLFTQKFLGVEAFNLDRVAVSLPKIMCMREHRVFVQITNSLFEEQQRTFFPTAVSVAISPFLALPVPPVS